MLDIRKYYSVLIKTKSKTCKVILNSQQIWEMPTTWVGLEKRWTKSTKQPHLHTFTKDPNKEKYGKIIEKVERQKCKHDKLATIHGMMAGLGYQPTTLTQISPALVFAVGEFFYLINEHTFSHTTSWAVQCSLGVTQILDLKEAIYATWLTFPFYKLTSKFIFIFLTTQRNG